MGDLAEVAVLQFVRARLAFSAGDLAAARVTAEAAPRAARVAGVRQNVAGLLALVARVAVATGDLQGALRCAEELQVYAEDEPDDTVALDGLGAAPAALHMAGDVPRAAGLYQRTLVLAARLPDPGEERCRVVRSASRPPGLALTLEGVAVLCAPGSRRWRCALSAPPSPSAGGRGSPSCRPRSSSSPATWPRPGPGWGPEKGSRRWRRAAQSPWSTS